MNATSKVSSTAGAIFSKRPSYLSASACCRVSRRTPFSRAIISLAGESAASATVATASVRVARARRGREASIGSAYHRSAGAPESAGRVGATRKKDQHGDGPDAAREADERPQVLPVPVVAREEAT